ncbi:MAG TPA: hypothetical protein VFB22_17395 [Candidatus Baltobacteraceae bacterium]|nr:hypothetical protein [Candidatus Baltobacteraceae bacterium]
MPNALPSPGAGNPTVPPSAAPVSSNAVLTYGASTAFQELPEVGGYSGAIAFPKEPEPTPAPAKKGQTPAPAGTAQDIAIGATLYVKKPEDGPDLNFEKGKGRHKKSREHPARALAWIELLPTHDATLPAYPRIAVDVPREIASEYRDGEFGIGLWNSGAKDNAYRLAVEEVDQSSTPPPMVVHAAAPAGTARPSPGASASPHPSGMATMTPFGTPSPSPSASASPGFHAPGLGGTVVHPGPSAAPTLPPARMLFAGAATPLKLVANRPAIFVLYALPHPAATPTPSASPKAAAAATKTAGSPTPSPAASGSPAAAATKAP